MTPVMSTPKVTVSRREKGSDLYIPPSGDDDDGTSIWMSQSNIVAGYSTLEVSDPNSGAVTKLNHKPFVVRSVATSAELRWYWPV